jgi:hypothetical protein
MLRQRLGFGAVVFFVAIMWPRASSADMLDVLWQMSGPQLISVVPFEYRVPLPNVEGRGLIEGIFKSKDKSVTLWDLVPLHKRPAPGPLDISSSSATRTWFALDINGYASTSRDSDSGTVYDGWQVRMIAIEPRFDNVLFTSKWLTLYTSSGVSYDVLWGSGFSTFDKFALKVRPVGVMVFNTVDLGFNVRVYPNGFTSDEFSQTPQHYARASEVVYGFSGGVAWSKKAGR